MVATLPQSEKQFKNVGIVVKNFSLSNKLIKLNLFYFFSKYICPSLDSIL